MRDPVNFGTTDAYKWCRMSSPEPDDRNPLSFFAPEAGFRSSTRGASDVGDALAPLLRFDEEPPGPVREIPHVWLDARVARPSPAPGWRDAVAERERPAVESFWADIRRRVAAMSARVAATLNDTNRELPARRDALVGRLHGQALDTSVQLDQTATAFKALKHSIALALSEATYLSELVTALEKRTAKLTEKDQSLRHAHGTVWRLEQRAIKTTAQLRHVIRTTIDLERELALQRDGVDDVTGTVRERVEAAVRGRGLRAVGTSTMGVCIALAVGGAMIAAPSHDPVNAAVGTPRDSIAISPRLPVLSSRMWRLGIGAGNIPAIRSTIKTTDRVHAATDSDHRGLKTATIAPGLASDSAVHAEQAMQPEVFTGDLEIESDPAGATVLIDRRQVGKTPLQLHNVRIGSHVIWIERHGYRRSTRFVTVRAGSKVQVRSALESDR